MRFRPSQARADSTSLCVSSQLTCRLLRRAVGEGDGFSIDLSVAAEGRVRSYGTCRCLSRSRCTGAGSRPSCRPEVLQVTACPLCGVSGLGEDGLSHRFCGAGRDEVRWAAVSVRPRRHNAIFAETTRADVSAISSARRPQSQPRT